MSTYENPAVAADVVALRYDDENGLMVALHNRQYAPEKGRNALPGVLLGVNETMHDGLIRAVQKMGEATLNASVPLMYRDNPKRDDRGRVISIPHICIIEGVINDESQWYPIENVINMELPFDHEEIIISALEYVSKNLFPEMASLLLDNVTVPALVKLINSAGLMKYNSNLSNHPHQVNRYLKDTMKDSGVSVKPTGGGRPAKVFVKK